MMASVKFENVAPDLGMTKAKVDIARLDTSLLQGRMQIRGIQIADPRNTDKNLLQFKTADLQLDRSALLKRKFIVQQARLSGVRFNQLRSSSGALAPNEEPHDKESTGPLAGARVAVMAAAQERNQAAPVLEATCRSR